MYAWLEESLQSGAQIVTANRRLARLLAARFNATQVERGKTAWLRPDILDWSSWLSVLRDTADPTASRDVRINAHQSRILWEKCLAAELSNPDANIGALVRLSREARRRLVDWRVPLSAVGEYALGEDERFFANALNAYVRILERNRWIDDAGLAEDALRQVECGAVSPPDMIVMVGFTSPSALFDTMIAALGERGTRVDIPELGASARPQFCEFLDETMEFRAAGAWARRVIESEPDSRVAVVVSGLEGKAQKVGNLIREGFMPGWQLAGTSDVDSVNVSYGRALSDYPVVTTAISLLRWVSGEALSAANISILLRSRMTGLHSDESRVRTELKLRDIPDRKWTLELFERAFARHEQPDAVTAWTGLLRQAAKTLVAGTTPEAIAEAIEESLALAGWPGEASVSSKDFQVLNRWRELLNDFVRLSLVQPEFSPAQAISRLATMANETVFQPETEGALVNVLGALEASGSEFDALWVTGLTSRQWPPPARPLSLVSTRLQREFGMPDSTPLNTSSYAKRSLSALASSAPRVTFSFSRFEGDAEQARSPVLPDCDAKDTDGLDPGWFATQMVDASRNSLMSDDPVPAVARGETVWGGASTLDRQAYSPFDAFSFGRLGLRYLPRFSPAIQPYMRGNLIHDALRRLYRSHPDKATLEALPDEVRSAQIDEAVRQTLAREFRLADAVLRQVLRFEEQRMRILLGRVIDFDLSRDGFAVKSVEEGCEFRFKSLALTLKADRIDQLPDGSHLILDYKTGEEKKFLTNKEPNSFQLILYSLAYEEDVTALGLYNVDSRRVAINGAGQSLDNRESWDRDLAAWSAVALAHLERLIEGDLRINAFQAQRDSRQTALLSRVAELKRD